MEAKIVLGGKIDVVSSDEFNDAISGLHGRMDEAYRQDNGGPIRYQIPRAQTVSTASSSFQVSFGKPAQGRIWNITSMIAVANDDSTANANLLVSLYSGSTSTPTLADLLVPGSPVPVWKPIGDKVLWVGSGAEVYANVSSGAGLAAGSYNVVVILAINDWPDSSKEAMRI